MRYNITPSHNIQQNAARKRKWSRAATIVHGIYDKRLCSLIVIADKLLLHATARRYHSIIVVHYQLTNLLAPK